MKTLAVWHEWTLLLRLVNNFHRPSPPFWDIVALIICYTWEIKMSPMASKHPAIIALICLWSSECIFPNVTCYFHLRKSIQSWIRVPGWFPPKRRRRMRSRQGTTEWIKWIVGLTPNQKKQVTGIYVWARKRDYWYKIIKQLFSGIQWVGGGGVT